MARLTAKMFVCSCGNVLETDMALEKVQTYSCGKCGASKWTQKQGKAMLNDPSAPTELHKKSKKQKEDEE